MVIADGDFTGQPLAAARRTPTRPPARADRLRTARRRDQERERRVPLRRRGHEDRRLTHRVPGRPLHRHPRPRPRRQSRGDPYRRRRPPARPHRHRGGRARPGAAGHPRHAGKVADHLRTTEPEPPERAALDQGTPVRRGQGYTRRVSAGPAVNRGAPRPLPATRRRPRRARGPGRPQWGEDLRVPDDVARIWPCGQRTAALVPPAEAAVSTATPLPAQVNRAMEKRNSLARAHSSPPPSSDA